MPHDESSEEIVARVRPDAADDRDVAYERPATERLDRPAQIGYEGYRHYVGETWHQRGHECTGFALAAIANYLTRKHLDNPDAPSVSRRMLYEMAQRYDGEGWSETSTLRGALKGWARSGAARDDLWPYDPHDEDGSVHGSLRLGRLLDGRARQLRSYRKIVGGDIETMKDALADGHVLFASARLHLGWNRLFLCDDNERPVIEKLPDDELEGGHAFVVVGYDDTAACFWLHNSWGPEWGVEGYALLPYAEWAARGQDAWVVEMEPPLDHPGFAAPAVVAPTDAERLSYREMWPHLVVLRDDGKLAADGLYEMDGGSVKTLLFLFQEATIDWSRRRLAIVVDGGYLPTARTIARHRAIRDRLMRREIYPIFVVWETSWWADVEGELSDWRARLAGTGGSDAAPRSDRTVDDDSVASATINRSLAGLIWYEIARRSVASCESPYGGARLLAEAVAKKRGQEPNARRGPFDLHLVSHGAGDLLAAELAALLPAPISTATAIAAATSVSTFRGAYGSLLDRGLLDHLSIVTLDADAEDADRIGPLNRSWLRLVSDLRIDPGEAASLLEPLDGPAIGVAEQASSGQHFGVHRDGGLVVHSEVSGSTHIDLIANPGVVERLIDTMQSHESSFDRLVRLPNTAPPAHALPRDPLARADAIARGSGSGLPAARVHRNLPAPSGAVVSDRNSGPSTRAMPRDPLARAEALVHGSATC